MRRTLKNWAFFAFCLFWIVAAIWLSFNGNALEPIVEGKASENLLSEKSEIPPKSASNIVRVCSWNVRNYAVANRGGSIKVRPKPLSEKLALCKTLARINPDILLIQEIGEDRFLHEFSKLLAQEGQIFRWRVSPNSKMNSRLGILSKLPISKIFDTPDLTFVLNGECKYSPRSTLGVKLKTNGIDWYVYTIHLKSKFGAKKGDADFYAYRFGEMSTILDTVSAQIGRGEGCIGGDFNEEPRKITENLFASHGFALLDSDVPYTYYWAKKKMYNRYDYFYITNKLKRRIVSDGIKVVSDSSMEASDHNPIYVDFSFASARTN